MTQPNSKPSPLNREALAFILFLSLLLPAFLAGAYATFLFISSEHNGGLDTLPPRPDGWMRITILYAIQAALSGIGAGCAWVGLSHSRPRVPILGLAANVPLFLMASTSLFGIFLSYIQFHSLSF
jgi:hypothetical protein